MPELLEFDTQNETTVNFPRPFIACPRLSHGIRRLDMKKIRPDVQTKIPFFMKDWANCHFNALYPPALYNGVGHVFALAPSDLDFLTGEYLRHPWDDPHSPASVRVDFERPFVTPPKVVVFLNHIALDKDHNWRIITTASNIDVNGFTLNIQTWSDTVLYAAQTCWIAYPEDRGHIFTTSVSTTDIRPWNKPQLEHSKQISFNSVEFFKTPSVFIALNYLDLDCKADLRVNAYVDGISTTRLVWHIDTWDDTVLNAAGATIIAFN
jgi:hypothetical protein